MIRTLILIAGSLITVILAVLWYFDIVTEPIVAIGTAVLTLISYFLIPTSTEKGEKIVNTKIKQKHTGNGDNVGGDKIVN